MKKMITMIAMSLSMISLTAHAEKAELKVFGLSGIVKSVEGLERIQLRTNDDGSITIQGRSIEIREMPEVVSDRRASDGPLVLKIGVAELEIASGLALEPSMQLHLSGQTIKMNANVYFDLK